MRKLMPAIALVVLGCGPAAYADKVEFLNNSAALAEGLPFSEAVRVDDTLYLSGQIGTMPGSKTLVPGGIVAEAEQTLTNIREVLQRHGLGMEDVVKCTVMLADIDEWASFNTVYTRYFSRPYPARSAFGASGLALGAKVEVECIAVAD